MTRRGRYGTSPPASPAASNGRVFGAIRGKVGSNKHRNSTIELLEEQVREGSEGIWGHVSAGDVEAAIAMMEEDPKFVELHDSAGATPYLRIILMGHWKAASALRERFPQVVHDVYTKTKYTGENALHLAIVNQNRGLVRELVEACPALMKGKATGTFFRPTTEVPSCYYGQAPLGFAVCTRQRQLTLDLVEAGADVWFVDDYGNTLMHLLVVHGLHGMYKDIRQIWEDADKVKAKTYLTLENKRLLSPLVYAVRLSNVDMFVAMLKEGIRVEWTFGDIQCDLWPVREIDRAFSSPEAAPRRTALEVIVKRDLTKFVDIELVHKIVESKWDRTIKKLFYQRFVVAILAAIVVSCQMIVYKSFPYSVGDWFITGIVWLGSSYKIIQEVQQINRYGWRSYASVSGAAAFENSVSCLFGIITVMHIFTRLAKYEVSQAVAVSLLSGLRWMYLLFFFLGFRMTGPFIVMVWKMLRTDILPFFLIFGTVWLAFVFPFYLLFPGLGLGHAFSQSFVAALGDFETEPYFKSFVPGLTGTLLFVWLIMTVVILLNLLIALMGNTFSTELPVMKQRWILERIRICHSIEQEHDSGALYARSNNWIEKDGEPYFMMVRSTGNDDPNGPALPPPSTRWKPDPTEDPPSAASTVVSHTSEPAPPPSSIGALSSSLRPNNGVLNLYTENPRTGPTLQVFNGRSEGEDTQPPPSRGHVHSPPSGILRNYWMRPTDDGPPNNPLVNTLGIFPATHGKRVPLPSIQHGGLLGVPEWNNPEWFELSVTHDSTGCGP